MVPIFGGPPGLEPGSVIFNDVVPSAFVTKLSKVAGDKIEESPAVLIGGQGSNLFWTMYSLLHSPATNFFSHGFTRMKLIRKIRVHLCSSVAR